MAGGSGANAGDDTPPAWVVDLFGLFVDSFLEITKLESRPVSKVSKSTDPGAGDKDALRNRNSGTQNKQKEGVTLHPSGLLEKMSKKILKLLADKNRGTTQVPTGPGAGDKRALQDGDSGKQNKQKDQKTPAWLTKMSKFNETMLKDEFKKMFVSMK